jgi:hypothetical protein
MITRREAIAASAAAVVLAGIGISPAHADVRRFDEGEIDRELSLAISDGFSRQTWRYAGQVWTETRDTLSFHEDEHIRVYVTNDMPGVRVISLGDDRPVRRVRPGETIAIDLTVDGVDDFIISVAGQPAISRPVRVRASHGAHPNIA